MANDGVGVLSRDRNFTVSVDSGATGSLVGARLTRSSHTDTCFTEVEGRTFAVVEVCRVVNWVAHRSALATEVTLVASIGGVSLSCGGAVVASFAWPTFSLVPQVCQLTVSASIARRNRLNIVTAEVTSSAINRER